MSIWPQVEHGGFATQHLVTRPRIRVSAISYLPGVKSPLHVHPRHDQCIAVADGDLKMITPQGVRELKPGQSLVIPAGVAHGFESGTEQSRFLSVFLGEGANQPGKTALPEKIQKLLDPKINKHEKLVETFLSPENVCQLEDLTEQERDTLVWVVDRLIKRIETGRLHKRGGQNFKAPRRKQTIKAWHKESGLFLFSEQHRSLFSLVLKRAPGMHDYVQLNRVDIYWPTLNRLPRVTTV